MKKLLLVVCIVLVVGLIAGGVFLVQKRTAEQVPETAGQSVHAEPTPEPVKKDAEASGKQGLSQIYNILLIGVDNQNIATLDMRGNADGTIIATINPETEEIIFTSFMRDTRVRVRDSGYDKITNVFHVGGVELMREVLEQNFEIPIDYYALFNYANIIEIVDAVGGVEIELSRSEILAMEAKIINLCGMTGASYTENALDPDQAGLLKLNGLQAAAYARIRPSEGNYDAGRTERGRNVIAAIMGKAFKLSRGDMLQFASTFYDKLETDIPDSVFLELGMNGSALRGYRQVSDRIPIDGAYESEDSGSGFYIVPDYEVNNAHLKKSIYEGIHD